MRAIGVVTVARSDYGIYLPVLREIQRSPDLALSLIVSGMHLSPEFGLTVQEIERDGFEIHERVNMLLPTDAPEGVSKSIARGIDGFAEVYARKQPDILLVLGDRFEMLASVVAALPFNIPVAHIQGGESTQGAIDEAIRHSITKMAHLHFASTDMHAQRVIQMGEEPWRVTVSGAPALDNLNAMRFLEAPEIEELYGLDLSEPPLVVTYHPVTLEYEHTEAQLRELLSAIGEAELPVIFTYANADTRGARINEMLRGFVAEHDRIQLVPNLGIRAYFSLLSHSAAMVGNSSSGIIEAPSFKLPVVNVGNRQQGRTRALNVIDVDCSRDAILAGVRRALSVEFRASLENMENPYGDGHAAERIVQRLREVELGKELLMKRFYDMRQPATVGER